MSNAMLFPSLTDENGVCANSPGRQDLHRATFLSTLDIRILGRGSFGSVILGSWRGKRVAVKIIGKRSAKSSTTHRHDSITSELNAQDIVHDNVVRIHGVYPDPGLNSVIIMEYVGKSNLQTLLDTHPDRIDSSFVQRCFVDMAGALKYIHSKRVIHLDFKPGNIFVSSSGQCKLGDFGCSRKLGGTKYDDESVLVGTPGYQAPEYLQNKPPTEKCDVYSFGITMWQTLCKEYPFKNIHPHVVIYQVVSQGKRPKERSDISSKYRNLYSNCWNQNPLKRPSMRCVEETLRSFSPKRRSSSTIRL